MIKDRLMVALKSAAADYNGGMCANAAVAKAAETADFNEKQAERLVEMFNTLAALNKEKDASDPTGSCELASKQAVAKMLLDDCVAEKKASAADMTEAYSFYSGSPTRTNGMIEARSAGRMSMLKAASAEEERVPDELNVSQRSLYKIISEKIGNVKTAAAAADDVVRNLRLEAERNVVKIAKAIESPSAIPQLADMFKAACDSKKAVEMVSEYSTKVAESDGGIYARLNVFDSAPVEDLLKIAASVEENLGAVSEYERKRDMYSTKAAEAEAEMREAVGIKAASAEKEKLSDFFQAAGVRMPEKKAGDDVADGDGMTDVEMCTKIASLIRDAGVQADEVSRLAEDLEKDAALSYTMPIPQLVQAGLSAPADGGLKDESGILLNVRRSIILADLMANDPIIRDADPNQVAETYKTMVMTSPRVSLDKAQVRAFLRNAVNSVAVSPNDAKVISDVDRGVAMANVERLTNLDSSIKDSNKA